LGNSRLRPRTTHTGGEPVAFSMKLDSLTSVGLTLTFWLSAKFL
jgi:hypothetical protein